MFFYSIIMRIPVLRHVVVSWESLGILGELSDYYLMGIFGDPWEDSQVLSHGNLWGSLGSYRLVISWGSLGILGDIL